MVSESAYAPVVIPDIDIWQLLFEIEVPFPKDKVIYIDPQTKNEYTFAEVKETAIGFGEALRTRWRWNKGDVLAICATNCIDTPALIFGTLWANGVVSPANPAYSVQELAFQLKDCDARAIVAQAPLLKTVLEAAEIAGVPTSRILLIGQEKLNPFQHFVDFLKAGSGRGSQRNKQGPVDLAFIPYSSGTTGLPKGVMLTHRNIVANILQMDRLVEGVDPPEMIWQGGPNGTGDTILAVLPFFHIYGLVVLIHFSLHRGMKLVVLSAFVPEIFLKAIQDYQVTRAYLVPPIVLFLAKHPLVDKFNLSSLVSIISAAAPLTPELVHAVYNRIRVSVKQVYGLSETSPTTHLQPTSEWMTSIGSVGNMVANMSAKYVSADGKELPIGFVGELWLKGPNIFAGYWKNPQATEDCMTSDGFFKTGDIGYQDDQGNFYITDRLKELIKYKGFQVAPAELEGLLVSNEKISDACIVGVYDKSQATELPLAFVVKAPAVKDVDDKALEAEITAWVEKRVANHKKLRGGVRFVSEIPKSAAGKILRRILKDILSGEKNELKAKL
ncbi:hypothetical protein B0O99DRAFT_511830 [Bisporella sp. PMI_857]|nr:hypothetical protein B0O99DRAFT_511830 [Bisporella sp. PMI_857]